AVSNEGSSEEPAINDSLTGSVRTRRVHRVRRVTDQNDAAIVPGRYRTAVDQRDFVCDFRPAEQGWDIQPVISPPVEMMREAVDLDRLEPAAVRPSFRRIDCHFSNPVDRREAGFRVGLRNRIEDKAVLVCTETDKRSASADWPTLARAAPHDRAKIGRASCRERVQQWAGGGVLQRE